MDWFLYDNGLRHEKVKSTDVWFIFLIKYTVKNEWLLLPAYFTAKFGLIFVLTLKNTFFFFEHVFF